MELGKLREDLSQGRFRGVGREDRSRVWDLRCFCSWMLVVMVSPCSCCGGVGVVVV